MQRLLFSLLIAFTACADARVSQSPVVDMAIALRADMAAMSVTLEMPEQIQGHCAGMDDVTIARIRLLGPVRESLSGLEIGGTMPLTYRRLFLFDEESGRELARVTTIEGVARFVFQTPLEVHPHQHRMLVLTGDLRVDAVPSVMLGVVGYTTDRGGSFLRGSYSTIHRTTCVSFVS